MHKIASIPQYVLAHAHEYLTDKELLTIIQLQIVPPTKVGIEEVAQMSGYKTIKPIMTILNRLAEKRLIILTKYKVDTTPLYDLCLQRICGKSDPLKPKEKQKKDNTHYILASEILKNNWSKCTKNGLARYVKKLLQRFDYDVIYESYENYNKIQTVLADKEFIWISMILESKFEFSDFIGCLAYIDSYYKSLNSHIVKPIFPNNMNNKQIQLWIDGGRKKEYFKEKQKKDIFN